MTTENRSSNTEQMVSVPREVAEQIATDTEHDNDLRWIAKEMRKILALPAEQPQGEPFSWSYKFGGEQRFYPTDPRKSDGGAFADLMSDVEPLYRHPPTSDGFSAEQMAIQGADGYRNGIKAAAELAADYPELAQAIRDLPLPQ